MNAFLQAADEVVLIVEEMFDYFSLYFPKDNENRVVDGSQDHKDGHEFGPVGADELYGSDQDHQIFVYAEYAVAGDIDFLVVLNIPMHTWLYRSASLTLYWLLYQTIDLLVKL